MYEMVGLTSCDADLTHSGGVTIRMFWVLVRSIDQNYFLWILCICEDEYYYMIAHIYILVIS